MEESQPLELSSSGESARSLDVDGLVYSTLAMMDNYATQTEYYVLQAKTFLQDLDQPAGKLIEGTTVEVKRVLEAMINHAPCDRGTRYAACTVVACCQSGKRGTVEELHALAHDWFKFLILAFKTAYKSKSPPISEHSLVSVIQTEYQFDPVPINRPKGFLDDVKLRHQGNCAVLKGSWFLEGAHIIRRSLASGNNSKVGVHPSVPTTWDILRHYAGIDKETFLNIGDLIDSPENGMMLELNMHAAFDLFEWYLESREGPDDYEVKWLTKTRDVFTLAGNKLITFVDASGKNIALPRRRFIQTHAAMAQILHASGAGEYINTLLDKFLPNSSVVPVGKFNSEDLELRIFLANLADQNFHHLPASTNEIAIY